MWVLLLALSLCCILRATASSTNSTLSFTDVILAGAGARVFAQTLLHPLEVVRTRTQAFRGKTMPILPFRGKAGLLLKGISPQMLLSGPAGALQFGALEIAKAWLKAHAPAALTAGSLLSLWAGFFGAFVAAVVRIPQENLKQSCQASVYANSVVACTTIWRLSGLGGFYKGAGVTLARDILWNGMSYAFFMNWKASFAAYFKRDSSASEDLLLGALGGSAAAILTQPLDVAKTRIMIQKAGGVMKYRGVFSTVLLLLKEEGPAVLFTGIVTRIVYLAPFASLVFAANEFIKRLLLKSRQSRASASSRS